MNIALGITTVVLLLGVTILAAIELVAPEPDENQNKRRFGYRDQ